MIKDRIRLRSFFLLHVVLSAADVRSTRRSHTEESAARGGGGSECSLLPHVNIFFQ